MKAELAPRVSAAQLVRIAVIAGLIAGLGLGLFQFFVSEPVIGRAIQLEEQRTSAGDHHVEVFSRSTQRGGLIAAGAVYGVGFGLLFGGVYAYVRRSFGNLSAMACIAIMAAFAAWAVAVVPGIKYPAGPPGFGDPATIYLRQGRYVALVVLNLAGLVGAELLRRRVAKSMPTPWWGPFLVAAVGYSIYVALLLLFLPVESDASSIPSDLIAKFRAGSLGGQVLFWVLLGGVFAYLVRREAASSRLADSYVAP